MPDLRNRRPLASRDTDWARRAARALAATSITPNQISIAGMVAAALSGACFWSAGAEQGFMRALWLVLGAVFCQLRLLANLLDGMVAVEAGRGTPDGPFWNEFPDRVSDMLILAGIGFGCLAPGIGWAAVAAAFLTAYVRELGVNCGAPADFGGPMAKPHRMALVTGAALLSLFEPLTDRGAGTVLQGALWVVFLGGLLTALLRARRLLKHLGAAGD